MMKLQLSDEEDTETDPEPTDSEKHTESNIANDHHLSLNAIKGVGTVVGGLFDLQDKLVIFQFKYY